MGPRGTSAPDMACLGWVSSALRTGGPGVAAVLLVWVLVVTLGGVGAVAPSAAGHCSTHRFDGVVGGSERSGGSRQVLIEEPADRSPPRTRGGHGIGLVAEFRKQHPGAVRSEAIPDPLGFLQSNPGVTPAVEMQRWDADPGGIVLRIVGEPVEPQLDPSPEDEAVGDRELGKPHQRAAVRHGREESIEGAFEDQAMGIDPPQGCRSQDGGGSHRGSEEHP